MNKKAIAILGAIFLLIVGTLAFLIYSKYSTKSTQTTAPANTTVDNTQQTESANQASATPVTGLTPNIVRLTDDQVISPVLFYNGSGMTYFDRQGGLYQAVLQDDAGQTVLVQKKKLDIPVKSGISRVLWPAKGDDFIVELVDSLGKKSWSYFNSKTQTYTDLPQQVYSLDWMPGGDKILYIWLENNKATLNIGNPDTSGWQYLGDMWELDDALSMSPDGMQALYYETGNSSVNNAINSVSIDGKVWKGLVKTGQNLGVLWSPDGQKFLFGKKDGQNQQFQLWYYNLMSGETKNLGLFTSVDKAVWDKDSNIIYAAVPNSGSAGTTSLTEDSFFRMDTTTLEKKQYPPASDVTVDGRDLFLNAIGDKLFFRNAQDGGLYYLDLTK